MKTKNTKKSPNPNEILKKLTPQSLLLDLSKLNPDEVILPTVEELSCLGSNLGELRRRLRVEERKIREMAYLARNSICVLRSATPLDAVRSISPFGINTYGSTELQDVRARNQSKAMTCDWRGTALVKQHELCESDLPHAEIEEQCKMLADKYGSCRYGRLVAEWCSLAPYPQVCKNRGKRCVVKPKLGDPNGVVEYCKFHTACIMAEQPFLDKPCVLANSNGEMRQSCLEYLREQDVLWQKRKSKMQDYMDRIAAAMKRTDHKAPTLPIWRNSENWSVAPGELVVAVVHDRTHHTYSLALCSVMDIARVRNPLLWTPDMVILENDGEVLTIDINSPYVFKLYEALYLYEHRDYLEWLLLMCCLRTPEKSAACSLVTAQDILKLFDTIGETGMAVTLRNCAIQQANHENDAEQELKSTI